MDFFLSIHLMMQQRYVADNCWDLTVFLCKMGGKYWIISSFGKKFKKSSQKHIQYDVDMLLSFRIFFWNSIQGTSQFLITFALDYKVSNQIFCFYFILSGIATSAELRIKSLGIFLHNNPLIFSNTCS